MDKEENEYVSPDRGFNASGISSINETNEISTPLEQEFEIKLSNR